MKFTIEVRDFWIEDESLEQELRSRISKDVVNQISDKIKDKVEFEITKKIEEIAHEKIVLVIDSTINDFIATGTITKISKEISLISHLRSIFDNHHGWNNPEEQMKKIAKKFGEELKIQYNNIFANKIVSNLREQGFLKDEVVQMLLEGKK